MIIMIHGTALGGVSNNPSIHLIGQGRRRAGIAVSISSNKVTEHHHVGLESGVLYGSDVGAATGGGKSNVSDRWGGGGIKKKEEKRGKKENYKEKF